MNTATPDIPYDSILLTHGRPRPRVYVLLHGLTASPLQFGTFGAALFDGGANVLIPRLPHHGYADRLTTALRDLTADELRAAARAAVAAAHDLGGEVVIAGFSVGGLLAAWIGQHEDVARAVAIAPFLGVAWLPPRLTGVATRLVLAAPNQFWWWHPLRRERHGVAHGYPRFATHAVAQAAALGRELFADAQRAAPRARELRVVLNARESTVNNDAVRELAARWRRDGADVRVQRIDGLPLSHDIIEPARERALAPRVYPALLDIVAA